MLIVKNFINNSIITILSCIGSGLVIISTLNFGIGLEPDSASYIATARNLLLGNGFASFDAQPLTLFPPLYSILLASLSFIINSDPIISAAWLNALLFGLIVFKSGIFLTKYAESKPLIILGVLIILFSEPVFSNSLWALSDLLFILFLLMYLEFLFTYIHKNDFHSFIKLIIISALALLTRYIGITFIITTAIVILLYNNNHTRKKIIYITAYSILSFAPIGIWLIRNYVISGTIAGERGKSRFSIFVNIIRSIHVFLDWCLPGFFGEHKFIVILIFLPIIVMGLLKIKKIINRGLFLDFKAPKFAILITSLVVYFFVMILVETLKAQSAIDSRLLSPIYIPFVFFLIATLQIFYNAIPSFKDYKLFNVMISVFFIIGISNMCFSTVNIIKNHFYQGAGYSGALWKNDYAVDLYRITSGYELNNSTIYSNEPYVIYFYLNKPVKLSPMKTYEHSNQIYCALSDLEGYWPSAKQAYLIWFKNKGDFNGWLFNQIELRSISYMKLIDSSDLWSIYSVEIKKM